MAQPDGTITLRATIVRALREWLHAQAFVEVDTPVFITAPAPERFIDAVAVPLRAGMHAAASLRYAQTSPELAMKQILALGLPRIYQVAAVLRDGDFGPHHRPEFRLLEWYRAGADWQAGMADCEALLRVALQAALPLLPASKTLPPALLAIAAGQAVVRTTFGEAALRYAGLSPQALGEPAALRGALAAQGLHTAADDSYEELCQRLWVDRIELGLAQAQQPVLITHFPAPLASFAQLEPMVSGAAHCCQVAQRFELYACGLELANGFTEVTCQTTIAARFAAEQAHRQKAGKAVYPNPSAFLASVPHQPGAMGVAMGLERLLMVVMGATDIDDVAALPYGDT